MASTALLMDDKPAAAAAQQAEHLKCPRCDSSNTKFCYYNNYSLSQPRHFCKSCKRYWTRGGTLRNVPVGGGCRKNKRLRRPSSAVDSTTAPSSNSSSAVVAPTSLPHQIDLNPIFYGLPTTAPQFPFSARYNDLATEAGNYHDQLNRSVSGLGFSSASTPAIASLLASTFHSHNKTTPSSPRLESFQALSTPPLYNHQQDQTSRECSSGINEVKGEQAQGQQWSSIINMSGCQNPMEQQIGLPDPFLFWNMSNTASQFGLL